MTTSHPSWVIAAAAAGGMPAEACPEIVAEIESFHRDDDADLEIAGIGAKANIAAALESANELSKALAWMESSPNYQRFNTNGEPVDTAPLATARQAVDQLFDRLEADRKRFMKQSKRNRDDRRLDALVQRLLEIRSSWSGIGFPLQAEKTRKSGQFRAYIKACVTRVAPVGELGLELSLERVTRKHAQRAKRVEGQRTATTSQPPVKKKIAEL
jgi:hypothetical protein